MFTGLMMGARCWYLIEPLYVLDPYTSIYGVCGLEIYLYMGEFIFELH